VLAAGASVTAATAAQPRGTLSTFVAIGDSLAAGVQNIGLEASLQEKGFAALIARQAGVPFVLPLVQFPGAPPVLRVIQNGPIPLIGPMAPPQLVGRLNPTELPHNFAVPSFTVANALEYRPNASVPPSLGDRGPLVLGFPGPFLSPGLQACMATPMPECIGNTMVELAKARKPTTTLIWLGNNDALIGALFGDLNLLTPVAKFESDFTRLMDEMASTGSALVVGTIPDVTQVPYFSSASEIASQYSISVATLSAKAGIGSGDYVRRSALPLIDDILRNKTPGPLPVMCPPPIYVLPPSPCRLVAAEAEVIRDRIKSFNKIIAKQTHTRGGILVDTNKLVERIDRKGYVIGNERLTTKFLGGLFSLDGIHPSDTGYGVVANYFIDRMNKRLGLNIPKVRLDTIWAADPLRQFATTLPAGRDDNNDDVDSDE
jgi:lysophospholipase L1-like esterase